MTYPFIISQEAWEAIILLYEARRRVFSQNPDLTANEIDTKARALLQTEHSAHHFALIALSRELESYL